MASAWRRHLSNTSCSISPSINSTASFAIDVSNGSLDVPDVRDLMKLGSLMRLMIVVSSVSASSSMKGEHLATGIWQRALATGIWQRALATGIWQRDHTADRASDPSVAVSSSRVSRATEHVSKQSVAAARCDPSACLRVVALEEEDADRPPVAAETVAEAREDFGSHVLEGAAWPGVRVSG